MNENYFKYTFMLNGYRVVGEMSLRGTLGGNDLFTIKLGIANHLGASVDRITVKQTYVE